MPEGWTEHVLGSLCRPRQWTTIGKSDLLPAGVPVFGANGYIGFYSEANHENDTIIITCRGATCGEITWVAGPSYITGNAMCLDEIRTECIDDRFLYSFLTWRGATDFISGSAQPQIIRGDIEKLPVVVPSLVEQRRIAAVLDTWDEATATTEHLVETLIRRRIALSRQAFSASSPMVALEKLGRFEKGRGLAKADVAEIGVPCLRYAEIYTRYGDTTRQLASRASPAGVRSSRRLLSGEIVFAASGETAEEIGKAVAYLGDEPAVVGGDTVILTGHNQNAAYLAYALNSPSVVRQKSAAGKGHSVVHIHAPDLAKIQIPLPTRDTQDQVAAVFMQADHEIEGRQVVVDLLRRQKRGLMQKLFTGEWRVPATGDAFVPGGHVADRLEAAE